MAELLNLEKLHPSAKTILKPYIKNLLDILGSNVKSIIVFGSGITKDFIPKKSNINLLVVCEQVEIAGLKKSLKLISKGRKKGIVAPLFLTVKHMDTSSDVFPIEFLEMKDFHLLIYGEEVFDSLEIGTENLRLECEEQLKGKLIRLRQAYLESGRSVKQMGAIVVESLTSLIPVFRGMLRLLDKKVSAEKEDTINEVSREFGTNSAPLADALAIKLGKRKLKKDEMEEFLNRYLTEIQKLAVAVDQLKRTEKVVE